MRDERYSIHISDYSVEVYGEITMAEAFDLVHYFDQQGYTHLTIGHENSTLRFIKPQEKDPKESPNLYEVLLKDQEKTCQQLRDRLKTNEEFVKMLLTEDNEAIKRLEKENMRLCSELSRKKFESNPEALKIVNQNELSSEEKDEYYTKLLKLKEIAITANILSGMGLMSESEEKQFEESLINNEGAKDEQH